MADIVFNIVKGACAEKFRDSAANGIILLLTTAEADAAVADHDNLSVMLAGSSVEATGGSYVRKTGITGSITVDDSNERVDVDMPDQTWTAPTGHTVVKAVFAYEEAAADTTRLPLTQQDFSVTTDGSDLTIQLNAAGFYRAA